MRAGAWDYLTKPYVERDLMARVAKAVAHRRIKDRNEGLKQRLRSGREADRPHKFSCMKRSRRSLA